MWDQVLEHAPQILQAISIAVTAVFAIIGLNAWRRQIIGKRRLEVAEEALLAAYKVRDAMSYIRSSGSFGGEGRTRPRAEGEKENGLARAKDTYFVPLERIHRTSDDFAAFQKARLLCVVHFGADAGEPFDAIIGARNSVSIAAGMLVGMVGGFGAERQQPFMEVLKARIWEGYAAAAAAGATAAGAGGDIARDDAIANSVAEAVARIEALCRPHLKA
jgi:hypothetical protein